MHSFPLYSPDGMRMTGGEPEPFVGSAKSMPMPALFDYVLPHERDDDGLVHNHNWAASSHFEAPSPTDSRPERTDRTDANEARRFQQFLEAVMQHDRYDDGLVHNHDWAVTGK